MPKLSIAIPCYEYNGKGTEILEYSFQKFELQSFKDFEIVISDHSKDNKTEILCKNWSDRLDIKYYKNEKDRGNGASNFNNAIQKCNGEYIKLLCEDDILFDENSLDVIVKNLYEDVYWQATSYVHSKDRINFYNLHHPKLNSQFYVVNTIGTPSCITVKNLKDLPLFDINLNYCWDEDWYYRLYLMLGYPKFVYDPTMINFIWDESITSSTTMETIEKENIYILKKYGFIK